MKHNFMTKMASALLAVVLSTAAFSVTAFASGGEESTESVAEQETAGDVFDLLSALAGSQVTVGEIKRLSKFASRYEDDFVKAVMGSTQQNVALDRKLKEKELAALQARDEELDGLFERIYEDNVSGKLSDDRFAKMSRRYEDEQKEISEKIKALRAEMDKLSSKSVTADMFISTVRKYTRAKVLTPRMLNELIDHIEVHQAEKIDGIWEQHLVIHYNCVGAIFIPDVFPLPAPQVSVNTRKGVVVNYASGQLAV